MTREEAIEFGNMWLQVNEDCKDSSTYTFFHIAIEELKQEPKTGYISIDDVMSVFEQVMWERDIAIQQLKELGYEFGEKVEPQTTNACDGCKHFNSRYTACMFCFKRNKEKEDIEKAESEE